MQDSEKSFDFRFVNSLSLQTQRKIFINRLFFPFCLSLPLSSYVTSHLAFTSIFRILSSLRTIRFITNHLITGIILQCGKISSILLSVPDCFISSYYYCIECVVIHFMRIVFMSLKLINCFKSWQLFFFD